jgi:phosphoribosylanthranilate isomerase
MKVKICGIRTLAAARAAEAAGADFIGFVFAPGRRHIEPAEAAVICRSVRHSAKVGVFVDENWQEVNRIAALCGLDFVQLHGGESEAYAKQILVPVIKAFRWGDDFSLAAANHYPARYILLDSFTRGMAGGTGKSFDWQNAAAAIREIQKPVFIAGGISAANVHEVRKALQPFGVDASGSLEIKGNKSAALMKEFVLAVREADKS